MKHQPSLQNVQVIARRSLLVLLVACLSIFFSCKNKEYEKTPEKTEKAEKKEMSKDDYVKRGEYLVTSIGCGDCHSPKQMSNRGPMVIDSLKLSGYRQDSKLPPLDQTNINNGWMLMNTDFTAAAGSWGVSFAANLTSDDTGIGNWSLDQFKTAMKMGKFKGMKDGRELLPPMPWPNFAHLTDEDLEAIYSYLQSTKPVSNAVPAPIPPTKMDSLAGKS